jgi:putative oxidoreductase
MLPLTSLTDLGLLFLRIMAGLIFLDSGYLDWRDPQARSKSIGQSKEFTTLVAVAEMAGGAGVLFGVLQQFAAIGLILIMSGAIQKKATVWKTGFWGTQSPGWYYELTIVSMLVVILVTDGGRYVLMR